MTLIIRPIDRAARELSKTILIAFIGRVVRKIRPLVSVFCHFELLELELYINTVCCPGTVAWCRFANTQNSERPMIFNDATQKFRCPSHSSFFETFFAKQNCPTHKAEAVLLLMCMHKMPLALLGCVDK